MTITIHRGTHQIGGCATEIKTKNTRIIIDFGAELESEAQGLNVGGVTIGEKSCDAMFFSHYHGDHIGLMDTILEDIPLYMGADSKGVLSILNGKTKNYDDALINRIRTFNGGSEILIGDIKITPYFVDHSAYDAYMFLIEADGKRILHTGDFRVHGFKGKGLPKLLSIIGHVDVLICEGTTLNRDDYTFPTENEIKNKINKLITENKYSFVVCSSTNIDRIAGICAARPKGRYLLCDEYQKEIIDYIAKTGGKKSSLYKCDGICVYGANLHEKLLKQGFCMLVRAGNPYHKKIMEKYKQYDPLIIYSMWKGYLQEDNIKDFIDGYRKEDVHTSGHANKKDIEMVIKKITPDQVIPIHTEIPQAFKDICGDSRLILLNDGEEKCLI